MQPAGNELRDRLLRTVVGGSGGVRYHVRELVGEGGQGWVYKANYDDPEGFWVVVKVLRPDGVHTEALRRFEREAEVLRMLGAVSAPNPNIVRFYDYGEQPVEGVEGRSSLPFMVLEYVEGQPMSRVIQAHGGFGLPVARVRRVMKQVARALHTVHAQRIVHRDLKPSNILLMQQHGQEVAKVTDFGLVKLPELSANRTVSMAGASLGYAPPEQYEMGNNRVSIQTDVFSFGAILFEALSGCEAFPAAPGENPLRMVARMLSGERPTLLRVSATVPRELRDRPDLAAALDREIARAMSPDPESRHRSIRELWETVEPMLSEATGRSGVPSTGLDDALSSDPPIARAHSAPPPVSSPSPTWRIACKPMTAERLRTAVIAPDGRTIVALGSLGLYHYRSGVWSAMRMPRGIDARFIRGIERLPSGEILLFGDAGFAATMGSAGAAERVPVGDADMTLLGALADDEGMVFVGERLSKPAGVVVEVPRNGWPSVRVLEGATRLHGVARLAGGALLVCGAHGAIFLLAGSEEHGIAWGRTGHLLACTAALDGGAFAVGSGGHALRVAPREPGATTAPVAVLEAVQTTRDLTNVVVDAAGTAWAVGGQARLVERRQGLWMRVPVDPAVQAPLIAVRPRSSSGGAGPELTHTEARPPERAAARTGELTVVAEDATVLEGRL